MKKYLSIALIVFLALALISGAVFFLVRGKKPAKKEVIKLESEETLIEIPLEERPYVTLTPRSDGKELTLAISRIKNAPVIEYELVYLSSGLSRGVIGSISLKEETSIERNLLLGSCSKNVCKYDEDVNKGTLTLRFRGPDGVRKFITDFYLQQGKEALTSLDNNFQIKGKFFPTVFYLVMSTIGLPEQIGGQPASGIYGVFSSAGQTIKNGTVTLTLAEEKPGVSLYSWKEKVWQEEKRNFETDGKTFSASIDRLATFVAVSAK